MILTIEGLPFVKLIFVFNVPKCYRKKKKLRIQKISLRSFFFRFTLNLISINVIGCAYNFDKSSGHFSSLFVILLFFRPKLILHVQVRDNFFALSEFVHVFNENNNAKIYYYTFIVYVNFEKASPRVRRDAGFLVIPIY